MRSLNVGKLDSQRFISQRRIINRTLEEQVAQVTLARPPGNTSHTFITLDKAIHTSLGHFLTFLLGAVAIAFLLLLEIKKLTKNLLLVIE